MNARRKFSDAAAKQIVTAGGLATIAGVAGIFLFICAEVLPLFRAPSVSTVGEVQLGASAPVAVGIDEYRELLVALNADGSARVLRTADGTVVEDRHAESLKERKIVAAARAGGDRWVVVTDRGERVDLRLGFGTTRAEGVRRSTPRIEFGEAQPLTDVEHLPVVLASSNRGESGSTIAFTDAVGTSVQVVAVAETTNVFGDVQRNETRSEIRPAISGRVVRLAVGPDARRLYVASDDGMLEVWDLSDASTPHRIDTVDVTDARKTPVTALELLLGGGSLVTGDAAGRVRVWFPTRDVTREGGWRFAPAHELPPHTAAVVAISSSTRDRTFLTLDVGGHGRINHATTAAALADLPAIAAGTTATAVFAPKTDGGLIVAANGKAIHWTVANPHPEASLAALFGRVWYEGYEEPAFVWQSTGGTDDFEPKLSLVPLIIGTLKGTFYALLFAVPVAVFAALYTAQFAHSGIRNVAKPAVEIMAALPSVVLGFLAGLWLAPAVERNIVGVMVTTIALPAALLAAGVVWGVLPRAFRLRVRSGRELLILVPMVCIVVAIGLLSGAQIEHSLFGGSFRSWLDEWAALRFDQRNSLVVGMAMGFAVIPIIFTISEDALSNVPPRLVSASLALGATRWQTALRVVLPTASPGIFSAVMIGFGRAVGETMIVLMATGNTPVLDWNPFTGMRTLSANIAVEIPEAPHGGTLYRVLFVAALLLFATTFVVNTAAEVVRARLRRRYQNL